MFCGKRRSTYGVPRMQKLRTPPPPPSQVGSQLAIKGSFFLSMIVGQGIYKLCMLSLLTGLLTTLFLTSQFVVELQVPPQTSPFINGGMCPKSE